MVTGFPNDLKHITRLLRKPRNAIMTSIFFFFNNELKTWFELNWTTIRYYNTNRFIALIFFFFFFACDGIWYELSTLFFYSSHAKIFQCPKFSVSYLNMWLTGSNPIGQRSDGFLPPRGRPVQIISIKAAFIWPYLNWTAIDISRDLQEKDAHSFHLNLWPN